MEKLRYIIHLQSQVAIHIITFFDTHYSLLVLVDKHEHSMLFTTIVGVTQTDVTKAGKDAKTGMET